MAFNFYFGFRTPPDKYERVPVENVNSADNVSVIRKIASEKFNIPIQKLELIYCGLLLNDNWSLLRAGIKPGVTVHVFEKQDSPPPICEPKITEEEVQKVAAAFRALTLSPGYHNTLQRLSRPEVLEDLMTIIPGLADDLVAVSIIRDAELIGHLAHPEVLHRVVDLHPALIRAAYHIATDFQKDTENLKSTSAGPSTTGRSYSLDALSDDDDDDDESESYESLSFTQNPSYNVITAAQVAAAIANANTGSLPNTSTNPIVDIPASGGSGQGSSHFFNNSALSAFAGDDPSTNLVGESSNTLQQIQPQMQQMREMGLLSNAINFRALQTTSGDLQAAIELVLSGAFD